MKTKYRSMASVCGAAVLAVVFVPDVSPCGGFPTLSDPVTIQQLKINPKNSLEGASAETVFGDLQFGYAQFHSDGTEFYNSGGFAPATQNYCLGVVGRNRNER